MAISFPPLIQRVIPKDQAEAFRRALLGMQRDPQAQPLLLKLKFPGFAPAEDRDYDNVRRIYRKIGQ